jgi:hypothetical protein
MIPRLCIVLCNFFKPASAEEFGAEIKAIAEVEHCAMREVFADNHFGNLDFDAGTIRHINFESCCRPQNDSLFSE